MDIYSEKKAMKDLNSLYAEAVYGKPKSAGQELAKREKDDDAFGAPNKKMIVTNADKKANTPAHQNYKKGDKRYAAADHLKREEYGELYSSVYDKELQEKQKDTPDQVKAVIAFDKARKGTDDATYDSEHGKKKQAKKERDYAKWQRDKGAEDAQKSGHPWEHAKGSTREKEGKKSEKHAHIKDSYQLDKEALNLYHSIYNEEKPGAVAAALTKSTPKSQPDATPNKKVMGAKGETLQKNTANTVHTKVKEGFSSWRDDLKEYTNIVDEPESKADRKVKESKIKNKVVIDPEVKLEQALGGKVESIEEAEECPKCGEKAHKGACVKEEILWDKVAIALTELSEMNDVRFKVVAEHHERDADGNVIEHDDVSEGQVKKELKDLSKASKTLKGKYVAKADEVEEEIQYLLTILTEAEIGDILARLEKKRISKGGNPDDSPLPAMKKYHAKKRKVKKGDWIGPPPKK